VTQPRGPEGLRVVIADDDEDQRLLLRELFARAGVDDLREAPNGTQALALVREEQPDLVVLDLAMPSGTGLEVLPHIREAAPDAHVVVLTNLPRWRLAPITRRLGATGFVEKRVPPRRLVASILSAAALASAVEATASSRFEAGPTAPGQARHFVRDLLGDTDASVLSTVELLVTELVTNAIVHASSTPTVDVFVAEDNVRIAVRDADPSMPRPRRPDPTRAGGRGMVLLEELATTWGADPDDDGKVVWFEIDLPSSA
jgi:DNA-binding NarL/FixJ family response regulator